MAAMVGPPLARVAEEEFGENNVAAVEVVSRERVVEVDCTEE